MCVTDYFRKREREQSDDDDDDCDAMMMMMTMTRKMMVANMMTMMCEACGESTVSVRK